MTGPYHYKRAEEMLVQIEAANAVHDRTVTALAIQAQAHAILAFAAAPRSTPAACRGTSGTTWQDARARIWSDRTLGPTAVHRVYGV